MEFYVFVFKYKRDSFTNFRAQKQGKNLEEMVLTKSEGRLKNGRLVGETNEELGAKTA